MKKILLFCVTLLITSFKAYAYDFEVNGVFYEWTSKEKKL